MENKLNPQPQRCQWSPDLDNRWTTTSLKRLSRSSTGSPSTIDNVFVFLRFALCLLLMVGAGEYTNIAYSQAGNNDATFNPNNVGVGITGGFNDFSWAIKKQVDGKIVIGGRFSTYNGVSRNKIARLNIDGSLDLTFNIGSGFDGDVAALVLQIDGKIVATGPFTSFNGVTRNRIARLNIDGSLDTTFDPGLGFDGGPRNIVIQSDNKVVVFGGFSLFNGITRNTVARLNTDGSLDTTFDPGLGFSNSMGVFAIFTNQITIQSDGKIIIASKFNLFNGITRKGIARLNTDGSLDTTFDPGIGFSPFDFLRGMTLQSDGKILVTGNFTSYNGVSRSRIVRINTDGQIDLSFDGGLGGISIRCASQQVDGKIVLGGGGISRLNADGSLDTTFDPGTGFTGIAVIESLEIQTDGKILTGGNFTAFWGIPVNYIARLHTDGSLDAPGRGFDNGVYALGLQPDEKIIAGGTFTTFNGKWQRSISRMFTNGTYDASFDIGTGFSGGAFATSVQALAIQTDSKIIAGGDFTIFNSISQNNITRLNSNGNLDASFNTGAGFNGAVSALALQIDGKIVVGGSFTSFNGSSRNSITRLNTDGSIDASFNIGSGFVGAVNTITLQTDGKIIVGGTFTSFDGTSRNQIVRLNVDGSLDTTFDPGTGFNNEVRSLALQTDGKIVVGGSFTSFNGTPQNFITRLNPDGTIDATFNIGSGFVGSVVATIRLQTDGKIIVGGFFTSFNGNARNHIVRLNINGTIDLGFTIGIGFNNSVRTLTLQNDSKIVAGGDFSSYSGISRNRIIRLLGDIPLIPSTLTATPTSAVSIGLAWTDNSTNEIAFKVQRSITSGTGFTTIATLAANTITYTDNTVAAGTTYYYRILATNGAGDSAPSNEANANTLSFGLVAYYPFSGNANDASGNGNNGTVNGATLTTDRFCNPNSAYNFDGVSNYIEVTGGLTLSGMNDITISAWVFKQTLGSIETIVAKWYQNTPNSPIPINQDSWGLYSDGNNVLGYTNNLPSLGLATTYNFDYWENITFSHNSTEGDKIYVNGILKNTNTVLGTIAPSINPALIGVDNNFGTYWRYFQGKIDDIRIYNRALSPAEIATLYDVTAAPSALSATAISSSQINLSWTDNSSNEDSYVVERSLTSGSGFAVLATLPANTVAYSDNTVGEGVSYFYRVTALKACYQSPYSNEATATTPFAAPTVSAIAAPTPLAASLTFADNSTIEDNVILERSLTANVGFAVLATLAPNATTYTDNTVTEGITYFYRLRNFKTPITYSAYSAEASVGVPAFAAPTALFAAAVNITQINLSWVDNTTFETAYLLERSLLPTGGFAVIATLPASSTFYADNTALPATQYYYRVRAELTPIFSAYSNVAGATTADITPLAQATNITLTNIFAQSLGISWTNGNGANRVVKINTSNNFTNLVNATAYTANSNYSGIGEQVVYNSSGNTAFIGGLQPKTKYFFKVYEYNGTGVTASYLNASAQGNPASFLTFATPPIPPTDLVFTDITTTTISGRFKPIVADGYLIVRRAKESSPQTPPNGYPLKIGDTFFNGQVVVGVGKLTTFKAEKLTPATDYTFDIYAYNGENESIAYSAKALSGTARTHNPLPILEAIAPTEALAGQGLVTLSAFGKDFINGATVLWEGIPLPTVFVSENELKAEVNGSYLLTARKYNISISNPPLGGGKSKELPFEVKPSYLVESVKVGDKFVLPETQNHLLHRICIYVFGENNALKQIKFDLSGTFKPQDLEKNAFTLWVSKDTLLDNKDVKLKDFPAASRLVFETVANTPLPIKVGEPLCLLLTANIAEKATAGHTIQVSPLTEKDIQLSKEVALLSGVIPYQIGGVQTIQRIYLDNPTDSLLLVRWCRSMKGEAWERKWDFSKPVGKWHGIDLDQNGKVRSITLVNNNLQGDLSDEIFTDEDGAITSEMRYLNCSGNKITGEMPEKIGKCKKMEYLDLSKNLMRGKLTEGIGEVRNLVTLWLSYNRFEEIPESIENCQKLRNLHCNNNKINKLPENIGKLASLEIARFEGNELKKLPATFASLPNLKECYLQNNALHFEHLEPFSERPSKLKTFAYAPQARIGEAKEIYAEEGKTFEIQIDTKGKSNQYTWYKDEKPYQTTKEPAYKDVVNYSKTGTYKLVIQNSKCKDLTLESYEYKVKMYCNNDLVQIKAVAENNDVFCVDDKIEAVLNVQIPANVENKEKASFQWLKNSTPIQQAENQKFVAQEVGSYTVRVSLANGCTYLSETVSISKAEKIAVRLQREGNILKAITSQEVTNYEWFLNNRLLERNITSTLNMIESGRYKVRLTDKNGCQTTSAEENINVTALEEIEIENLSIELFPNPSANIFQVKLSKAILKSIWVFDAFGRTAYQESFTSPIQEYFFNLENKAVGIYWVRVQTTDGNAILKAIKE